MNLNNEAKKMLTQYVTGFALSLAITLCAYFMVTGNWYAGVLLFVVLGILALVQMIVQLYFFLHLGEELRPRLKLLSFVFMTGILVLIVVGTLWIMYHLNYNMMDMSPSEKTEYMQSQKDKGF